ncbi:MAG: glycoside hydrolase family 15 protein [Rubrobacter sp.]
MKPDNGTPRPLFFGGFLALVVLAVLALGAVSYAPQPGEYPDPVPLKTSGLIGSGDSVFSVASEDARGAEYLPKSNIVKLPTGDLLFAPDGADAPVTASPDDEEGTDAALKVAARDRAWLDSGLVPGGSEPEREIAARSLLNLRLLTRANGASLAALDDRWDYVWPRDASWASAALAATGYHEESYEILEFLARTQRDDGTWEARYHEDGSPVLDGRAYQLDASGWFVWAVWFYKESGGEGTEKLWPEVERAASAAAVSLGRDGLPPGGADYWEIRTVRPNLGTSAALLTGLRSASDLAERLGHDVEAVRYTEAAHRLDTAIDRDFAPNGYTRTAWPTSGRDAAVTFLAPPFAPPDKSILEEVRATEAVLTAPNGGILPGERWPQEPTVSWTAESAFFMLAAASSGDERRADRWLRWLAAHRTELGAFPEKVDADGSPKAAAPLGWTDATVLLALAAKEEPLPTPPAP